MLVVMKLSPALASATAFFYALGYPVGALAVRAATPGVVLVSRFAASALILAAIVLVCRLEWPKGRQFWHAMVVGFLTQGVQFVGCYQAMYSGVSPVLVALVIAMNPVVTAAAASRFLAESVTARQLVAVVVAFAAVCCAFAGRVLEVGHVDAGILWVVGAVFGLALGGVYQQRHLTGGHPVATNAVGVTVALVPALVFFLLTPQHVENVPHAVAAIGTLVIANSVIAASLYLAAIRQAGAAAVSLLFGIIPSIAALLSWLLVGERPDLGVIGGLVLGALACYLGAPRGPKDAEPATAEPAGEAVAER